MKYELVTERLILRPFRKEDLENVCEYATDKENTTYMYFLPYGSKAETAEAINKAIVELEKEKPEFYELAVIPKKISDEEKKDEVRCDKPIGTLYLYIVDEERQVGELGWVVNKKYWGRGIAPEAAEAMVQFAREKLGIKKIIASCDYRNEPSQKVMAKIGMNLEDDSGTRTYVKNGETVKELVYSVCV